MARLVKCPNCGAALQAVQDTPLLRCTYCHADLKNTFYQPPPSEPAPPTEPIQRRENNPAAKEVRRFVKSFKRSLAIDLAIVVLVGLIALVVWGVQRCQRDNAADTEYHTPAAH